MADSSDDLAKAVGMALSAWSHVEIYLGQLFHTLSDIPDFAKAHALFDAIVSFEIRLTLCSKAMEFEGLNALDLETWKRLTVRADKLYKRRHRIAHFSIVEFQDENGSSVTTLSPFFTTGRHQRGQAGRVSVAEISELAGEFGELANVMRWFIAQALVRRGRLPHNPVREFPLLSRCRESASLILARSQGQPPP